MIKMMLIRIPVTIYMAFLLAACQMSAPPADEFEPDQVETPTSQLTGTHWQLVEIQSMDDSVYRPNTADEFELQFMPDGELLVKSACNRSRGTWQANGSSLRLGPIALTRRACLPEVIDGRFNQDLDFVRSFVLREGRLFLATMADGAILEFREKPVLPSFSCDDAQGQVETMICSSPGLAALDNQLDRLYRKALDQDPDVARLKAMQRGWIKGRNDCWKASDAHACISDNYGIRMTELEVATGATGVPEPLVYQCQGIEPLLSVYYYNETFKKSALINYADDQRRAFAVPTASGAKYEGRNTSLWSKGTEARITWDGEVSNCKQILKGN